MKKIAIEGGPCAGKTTGLRILLRDFPRGRNFPLVIPEAATLLKQGGIVPRDVGDVRFQQEIVRLQIQNEDRWEEMARNMEEVLGREAILLCDRGILSGAAYFPEEGSFQEEVLGPLGLDTEAVLRRYHGVVHMVSVANDAPDLYTCEDNAARTEKVEEAKILDACTLDAWRGASPFAVPNVVDGRRISLEEKADLLLKEVCRFAGIPLHIPDNL